MVEGTFFFMHASCACCHTIIYGHTIHTVETAPKCINMLKSRKKVKTGRGGERLFQYLIY